jgi:long-chain acyl-CoA synthetase
MLLPKTIYRAPPDKGRVVLGKTLPSLLDDACDRTPNPKALNQWVKGKWQALSNQALRTAAEDLALGLLNLGLSKGDRVALLMHSDTSFCIADIGCLLAGLVNVPIDLTQTLENIIFILRHAEAKVLIVADADLLKRVAPALSGVSLQTIIVAEGLEDDSTPQDHLTSSVPLVFALSDVQARGQAQGSQDRQHLRTAIAPQDLATLIYVPGPSGQPRGVMLTHENISADILAAFGSHPNLKRGARETALLFLPLTHVFARAFLYGHLNYGHSVYFSSPQRVIRHLREVRPTIFITVPRLLEKVYEKLLEQGQRSAVQATAKARNKAEVVTQRRDAEEIADIEEVGGKPEGKETWRAGLARRYRQVLAFRPQFRPNPLPNIQWPKRLPEVRLSPKTVARSLAAVRPQIPASLRHSLFHWSFKLAQQYEVGRPVRGWYALQLKLADRLVFGQWRAVFGGRMKALISGGAALKPEIVNLLSASGIPVFQGYGLTETSSVVSYNRGVYNRAGSVGMPIAGVELAIAEDGEVLVKAPYVMQGYYRDPESTQAAIDAAGWFHTGDLGAFTPDGFLQITGVKKSLFKLTTGKYVTSQPLERCLEQSPLVAHAITVGANQKFCGMLIFPKLEALHHHVQRLGLDIALDAVLQHPCAIALYQSLVDEANCHLPYWSTVRKFQLINTVLTVENGMLTPSGAVNRAQVMATFMAEIEAMYRDDIERGRRGSTASESLSDRVAESLCPLVPGSSCPTTAQSLMHY